ncbi:MAG: hypothetical protein Q7S61_00355, partial [bacterium]|nr:hypothetical protein [bacterium]
MSNENLTHQQKLDAKQTEFTDGLSQGSTRYITATAPLPVPSFDLTKAIIHKDNQVISAQRREIQEENKR